MPKDNFGNRMASPQQASEIPMTTLGTVRSTARRSPVELHDDAEVVLAAAPPAAGTVGPRAASFFAGSVSSCRGR